MFHPFEKSKYITIEPPSRKPPCSSFDALLYVGLNDSFDPRQRFLNELSPKSKKKRGVKKGIKIDMEKAWLNSIATTMSRSEEEENIDIKSLKIKFLQFYEDVRPAYYGTWSKAYSGKNIVNGRNPFAKDTQVLNYDYDSEAEWDHDVDCDDIHTLDPDEDEDMLLLELTDEEEDGGLINVCRIKYIFYMPLIMSLTIGR